MRCIKAYKVTRFKIICECQHKNNAQANTNIFDDFAWLFEILESLSFVLQEYKRKSCDVTDAGNLISLKIELSEKSAKG